LNFKRIFLVVVTLVFLISCERGNKLQAEKLTTMAEKISFNYDIDSVKRQDSALALLNKAIEYDNNNIKAYLAKTYILVSKKDLNGLIENNKQLIRLMPYKPAYKMQLGFYMELAGQTVKAKSFYNEGLNQYKQLLKDTLKDNFDFRIEYVEALLSSDDSIGAKRELKKVQKDFSGNEILKYYKLPSKNKMKDLFYHKTTH